MRYPACFGTMKVRPPAAMCYTNECKAAGYCYDFGSLLDALIESKKKNFNEEEFNEFRLSIVDAMNTWTYVPYEHYRQVMLEELRK